MRLPGGDTARRLADRLRSLDYTVEGVRAHLGPVAAEALDREQPVPAQRALAADDTPIAVATRLLLLGEVVPAPLVEGALGLDPRLLGDLLVRHGQMLSAAAELAPYAADDHDWFVASDWSTRRTGRPAASDHVLGVGGASTMLAQCTVRPDVDAALDIGTGCGVQAFHLAGHARRVVGTDISRRCLELAALNAVLNDVVLELRQGSLFEPVPDERFDLVVSNPPFVIGAPARSRHDYRDAGLAGDGVCAALLTGAAEHLAEGGWCQLLANWEITDGDDWAAHPRSWATASGLDAWVLQREVQDPAEYVETWLRDAGEQRSPQYADQYDRWLAGLGARGVLGIGFGLITLRRGGRSTPVQRFQHAPQPWAQPVAPDVERWFAAQDVLADGAAEVLTLPLQVAPDVVVGERHAVGADQAVVTLERTTGMAWSGPVDPFGRQVLERLDGVRPAGEVVAEVAAGHGLDAVEALSASVPVLGRLLEQGFVALARPAASVASV